MTLFYEFGGNEDVPGEEYEYEVSIIDAYWALVKDEFGFDRYKSVIEFLDGFIDEYEFCDFYRERITDIFEGDAYREWKETRQGE